MRIEDTMDTNTEMRGKFKRNRGQIIFYISWKSDVIFLKNKLQVDKVNWKKREKREKRI